MYNIIFWFEACCCEEGPCGVDEIWEHGEYVFVFFCVNLDDFADVRFDLFQWAGALVVLMSVW
jgi:hypothetical protein